MNDIFYKRISFTGKLEDISLLVCADFKLGDFISNDLIAIGYEDFNFKLETKNGSYLVKVFAANRSDEECQRCVDMLLNAIRGKVSTPKLYSSEQGFLHVTTINNSGLRFCVMDCIEGKDLYQLNYTVSVEDIRFLAKQAALINSLNHKPKFIHDSWSIINFENEFSKKSQYLSKEDFDILSQLKDEFTNCDIAQLPHAFVHGDIISPNVMRDVKGGFWIIDFSVANYYPRIQELAILACDILFDKSNPANSEGNFKIALDEYQESISLTPKELEVLPLYIKFAHAMHVLLATHQKIVEKNDSEENEYFLALGQAGIRQTINI